MLLLQLAPILTSEESIKAIIKKYQSVKEEGSIKSEEEYHSRTMKICWSQRVSTCSIGVEPLLQFDIFFLLRDIPWAI